MNDFKMRSNQAKVQSIAQRYQTNLSSPKSSFIKSGSLQRSQLLQNLSTLQPQQNEEPSFIPSQNMNNSTEYINLWKDFRNDVRKKLQTNVTTNFTQSKSRGRDHSANNGHLSNRGLVSNLIVKTGQDQDISSTLHQKSQQYSNGGRTSFISNSNSNMKGSVVLQKNYNEQLNSYREQQKESQGVDMKIEYDLKRASKIQDIFQKYLKDDGPTSNRFQDQRDSVKNQTQTNASTYLRQSPSRNNAQPRQSSLMNKSPIGHRRDKSANLLSMNGNNNRSQVIDPPSLGLNFRDKFQEFRNERESLNPGSLVSSGIHNQNISQSTPYTPKRSSNFNFYESVNQPKQSPLTGKNLINNLDMRLHSQVLKSPMQSSQKKNLVNTSIDNLSAITKLQTSNFLSSNITQNKSPRVSFSISQFSKQYKKEEVMNLRQALSSLNVDEAEALPFGLQNELLRLAEVINEKLGRSNQRQVLNSFK
eukprot:403373048